ncbi:hypothetical protein LY90DRAFT_665726 [Neocallimastix californiae]|uniref:Uncharacterized protein n=1 Tax=Neocallimastix californiae TaxID=1754190 RepID=A0A1Y2EX75_9FUNG|nr:hypothetical protein LY90DRAFT_665726 [Neocallimastix californiae]|eukprot:ORY75854.1 hypothetical protein LY90DRAFT_665726 [Neocallimastix californiae]
MNIITDAKINENNSDNSLISKTIKKINNSILNGGKYKDQNNSNLNNDITTLNMSNNNSKRSSMSTSMVASPLLMEPTNYQKQYEEEERDKDNFDDLDFSDIGIDDLESRLDSYNHKYNDDTESCSSIIGISNDTNMNSNIDKISTSHSLKNISNIHNKEAYFSPEKLKNKQKHITINGPVLPLLKDERNEYKSKSSGLIHNYTSKSSSSTPITTPTSEKPNINNIPLGARIIKKKFNNFNVNKSTSTLDTYEGSDHDILNRSNEIISKTSNSNIRLLYGNNKIFPLSKNSSNNSSKSDTRHFSESAYEDDFNQLETLSNTSNTSSKIKKLDSFTDRNYNNINNSHLGNIINLNVSSISKSVESNKSLDQIISSSGYNFNANNIHHLNKKNDNMSIEVYGDEDFDFSGMDVQELKIDERFLLNPTMVMIQVLFII